MNFHHSRDCRMSPLFPHCDCGATQAQERLEELEDAYTDGCPVHHGAIHGAEAEELRTGIERLITSCEQMPWDSGHSRYDIPVVTVQSLQELLEYVDARDSLAHIEKEFVK